MMQNSNPPQQATVTHEAGCAVIVAAVMPVSWVEATKEEANWRRAAAVATAGAGEGATVR